MSDSKFVLEHYSGRSTRYTCPSCEKPHQFTRYVDAQTGEPIHWKVGRCNREVNCTYHYTPKQYFTNHPNSKSFDRSYKAVYQTKPLPSKRITDTLSWDIVERSLGKYITNAFVCGLVELLTQEVAYHLAQRCLIGTAKDGGTVFWQVDEHQIVHTGKVICYCAETLKRIKQGPDNREVVPQWAHTKLRRNNFHLRQCLFGQHLLATNTDRSVAIVESEKTAILCSVYLPDYCWLATGGCGAPQLKYPEVLAALQPYQLLLFPDTASTEKWETYAKELRKAGLRVQVRNDLEAADLDRPPNWDLADEFLAFIQPITLNTGTVKWALNEPDGYPIFWDYPFVL